MTISDQYRAAAKAWAEADGKARQLEAMKEPTLWTTAKSLVAEAAAQNEVMTITAAEREVKSSPAWHAYITDTGNARTEANKLHGEMVTLLMKHEEAHGPSRIRAA